MLLAAGVAMSFVLWSAAALAAAGPNARAGQNFTIVSAVIVNSDEKPLPGVPVDLFYPIVLDSGKVLASVRVTSSVTDGKGRIVLKTKNLPVLQKYSRSNDGWVNVDLLAGNRSLYLYRSVPRTFSAAGWIGTQDDGGSVDLGTLILAPGQPGVLPAKRQALLASSGGSNCTETILKVQFSRKVQTIVGELHRGQRHRHVQVRNTGAHPGRGDR